MEVIQFIGYSGALIIGVILGLMGGGGSILTVPLLTYLLGFEAAIATGYSLFVVGSSALVGVIQKHIKGLVDFKMGFAFCFPSFISVYLSRKYIVHNIPDQVFSINHYVFTDDMVIMIFFAIVMLFAAKSMIKKRKEIGVKPPQPYHRTFVQGIFIGLITGIIGAGGGFLYVPALVLWAGLSMKKAVGTSLVIVAINSLIGFLGDIETIKIDWTFLLTFTVVTIFGILLGGYLSKYVSNERLKHSFGYFILVMGIFIVLKELFQF